MTRRRRPLIQQNFVASPDYHSFQQRALAVLRRHPEALADWLEEFRQKTHRPEADRGNAR
jgi:hypothetical protein